MSFDLPSTGTDQPPAFLSAIACQDWLATVPVVNAVQAQSMFLRQLTLMHRFTLPPAVRFAILDALRGPVIDAQSDVAKKFAGRPLPLSPMEQAALDSTLTVWQMLLAGYLRCFDACVDEDPDIKPHAATVAQRTMSVFADWQVDLCLGEQLPDAAYWKKLHEIFAEVERQGLARAPVHDPVRHGSAQTWPLAAYGECHLLHTASPFELPARHLAWIARWACRWGSKLEWLTEPPEDIRHRAIPLWVDLDSDRPAGYVPRPTPAGRWLDTTELRKSLVARITLLEQGRSPTDIQLGDDVTQPAASQLLQRVLLRWCKGGIARRHERRSASGHCRFVAGYAAVHYQLSGQREFRSPTRDDVDLRREREMFETFGDRSRIHSRPGEGDATRVEDWDIMDNWQLLDESATGLRITRPLKEGARIGAGQLIAVSTQGAEHFTLGNVRWALRENGDSLAAGIQLFLGEPVPMAARPRDGDSRETFRPGFTLPASADSADPASLVLPSGTFRMGREIEVRISGIVKTVKLVRMLERGAEFERCAYE